MAKRRKKRDKEAIRDKKARKVKSLIGNIGQKRGEKSEDRLEHILSNLKETKDWLLDYRRSEKNSPLDKRGWDFLLFIEGFAGLAFPLQVKSSFSGKEEFEERKDVHVIVVRPDFSDAKIEKWLRNFYLQCNLGVIKPVFLEEIEEILEKAQRKQGQGEQQKRRGSNNAKLSHRIGLALDMLVADRSSQFTSWRPVNEDTREYVLITEEPEERSLTFVSYSDSSAPRGLKYETPEKDSLLAFISGNATPKEIVSELRKKPEEFSQNFLVDKLEHELRKLSDCNKLSGWERLKDNLYELEAPDGKKIAISVEFMHQVFHRSFDVHRITSEVDWFLLRLSYSAIPSIRWFLPDLFENVDRI